MSFFINKDGNIRGGRIVATAIAGVAAILLIGGSIARVPIGSIGVKTNMSQVTGRTIVQAGILRYHLRST